VEDILVFKANAEASTKSVQRFWLGRLIQELPSDMLAIHWFEAPHEFGQYKLLWRKKSQRPHGKKFVSEESRNSVLYSFTFDADAESLAIPERHAYAIRRMLDRNIE
jgi:hypothetical protein